jgi:signal transduction histidine kinase
MMATETEIRQRRQEALELNDTVVQRLAIARLALELGQPERARRAIDESLAQAKRIVTSLLNDIEGNSTRLEPGQLVRTRAATDT